MMPVVGGATRLDLVSALVREPAVQLAAAAAWGAWRVVVGFKRVGN